MTTQENSTLPADEKYKSLADRIKPKGTEDVGSDMVIQQFIEALPSALNFNIETIKGHFLKRTLELTVAVPQPSGEIIVLRDQEWVWEITESIDTWCITDCKELVAKVLNLANQGFQFIVDQFVFHYNTAPIKAAVAKTADKYKTDKSTIRDALTLLEEAEKACKYYGSYNLSPDEDTVEEGEFVQPPYISKNDFATARHVIGTLADWERFSKLMQLDYYGDPNYKTPSSFPAYEKEIWLFLEVIGQTQKAAAKFISNLMKCYGLVNQPDSVQQRISQKYKQEKRFKKKSGRK